MKRGEIWWAELGMPSGSGPGFKHPVLIIQNDMFTESKIRTVTCIVITSNENLIEAPGNIIVTKDETNLPRDSVVNVSQLVTIDKRFLLEKISKIRRDKMDRIEKGLLLALGIDLVRHFI